MSAALIPVRDAAELLFGTRTHRDYKRVLNLIHAKKIRHISYGSRYYVVRAALEELL